MRELVSEVTVSSNINIKYKGKGFDHDNINK